MRSPKELNTATGTGEMRWPRRSQLAVQAEEYAWSACEYAGILLQHKDPANAVKAGTLLNEALAIARELGVLALIERVEHLHPPKEPVQQEHCTYRGGLSQREVEVLRLIGLGKRNREIAEEHVKLPGGLAPRKALGLPLLFSKSDFRPAISQSESTI